MLPDFPMGAYSDFKHYVFQNILRHSIHNANFPC
jgi:hypothetical protein